MGEVLSFLTENVEELFVAAFAVHAAALAIVNLTPTPKDNEVLAKAYKVLEVLAGVFTKQVKK